MAVAAPWLVLAAAAYSGYQQYKMGQYQGDVSQHNAKVAGQAATDAVLRGQVEEELTRRRGIRLASKQRAAIGASGLDVGAPSSIDILADSAGLTELDALTIRNNAAREAWGLENQMVGLQLRGQMEAQAGWAQGLGTGLAGTAEALYGYHSLQDKPSAATGA